MSFQAAPFPTQDAIVNPNRNFTATQVLIDWTTALTDDVNAAPARLRTDAVVLQTASIGTTVFAVGALGAGLYRVSWYARITRAASAASSLTLILGWTESGLPLSLSGITAIGDGVLTGNTTGTVGTGTVLLRIDAGSPITYATTYSSIGATTMEYRLDLVIEQLDA